MSMLHKACVLWLSVCTLAPALGDVTIVVNSGGRVSVFASPDGGTDCERSAPVTATGGSATCNTGGVTAHSVLTVQTAAGEAGVQVFTIAADTLASVPPVGDDAEADLQFSAVLQVSGQSVRYQIDFDPDFGGGQTNDSFGSVVLEGHGQFRFSGEGLIDTIERAGILEIGNHELTIEVSLNAADGERVFANGTLTITTEPITEFRWNNAAGGDYATPENWDPPGVPRVTDTAIFEPVNGTVGLVISGADAKAGLWRISQAEVAFTGQAGLFEATPGGTSILVGNGGTLQLLAGTSLDCSTASIGVGDEAGTLRIRGQGASFRGDTLVVGDDSISRQALGRAEILEGGRAELRDGVEIGGRSPGECRVRGLPGLPAAVSAPLVNIGEGSRGVLTIEQDGLVQAGALELNRTGDGGGTLIVDGQDGTAELAVTDRLNIANNSTPGTTLEVRSGGRLSADSVVLGPDPGRATSVRVQVASNTARESTLRVTGAAADDVTTIVGGQGAATLEIMNGGLAELAGGLALGADSGSGTVVVSNRGADQQPGGPGRRAELRVQGIALLVGAQARSDLFVEDGGRLSTSAPVVIGAGAGVDRPSRIFVTSGGELQADGESLSIGGQSPGELTVDGAGSRATCTRLIVGGTTAGGSVSLANEARLTAASDTLIGAAAEIGTGGGSLTVGDGCRLTCDGRLRVGGGGDGGDGDLVLAAPFSFAEVLLGTRVESNGRIEGSGRLRSDVEVAALGLISPGVRVSGSVNLVPKLRQKPVLQTAETTIGTLTIEGDYTQEPDSTLVIEVAGTQPGQFDVLAIEGDADLAGRVELRFINGFVPETGAAVDFVQVSGAVTGVLTGGSIEIPANPDNDSPAFLVDATWTVTPDGTCRMTVTDVTPIDTDSTQPRPGVACGAGLCGAGLAPLLPMTVLGIGLLKCGPHCPRRRRSTH